MIVSVLFSIAVLTHTTRRKPPSCVRQDRRQAVRIEFLQDRRAVFVNRTQHIDQALGNMS